MEFRLEIQMLRHLVCETAFETVYQTEIRSEMLTGFQWVLLKETQMVIQKQLWSGYPMDHERVHLKVKY